MTEKIFEADNQVDKQAEVTDLNWDGDAKEPKKEKEKLATYVIPIGDNNDMLRSPTEEFDFNNPQRDPVQLAKELIKCMKDNQGIGLSANQIGIPLRVFCMYSDPAIVCYNPKITFYGEETVMMDEGCLSYPGVAVKIERPQSIRVRFRDPYGTIITKKYTGMAARVFQHELDHLDGIEYHTRANWFNKDKFRKRWEKSKRVLRKLAKR